jgi:hypothetical protein
LKAVHGRMWVGGWSLLEQSWWTCQYCVDGTIGTPSITAVLEWYLLKSDMEKLILRSWHQAILDYSVALQAQ